MSEAASISSSLPTGTTEETIEKTLEETLDETEDRYARHRLIDWWDQELLREAKVMVAGAGAIGNEVIKLLALSGIGHILIVDFDGVETSNLARTVLFRPSDIGQRKAALAAERAQEINRDIDVRYIDGDLEYEVGLGIYANMDVVIGCLDSIDARLAVNRACQRVGVPWINGGIEATLAEISLFTGDMGACFECGISPSMWERRNQRFSCTGLRTVSAADRAPTTAVTASIAAGYMVNEALLLLHGGAKRGIGSPESNRNKSSRSRDKAGLAPGQQLFLMFKPYHFHCIDLARNPECLAHERWEPCETLLGDVEDLTPARLLTDAGLPNGAVELGFDLLTSMRCVQCNRSESILRPLERCSETLNYCPDCNAASRRPETISWIDASSEFANYTLTQLCVPRYQILALSDDTGRRYVQLNGVYTW